jgi:hypothetical protein
MFLPAAQAAQPTEGYLSYDTAAVLYLVELPADNDALAHNDTDKHVQLIAAFRTNHIGDNVSVEVVVVVPRAGLYKFTMLADIFGRKIAPMLACYLLYFHGSLFSGGA